MVAFDFPRVHLKTSPILRTFMDYGALEFSKTARQGETKSHSKAQTETTSGMLVNHKSTCLLFLPFPFSILRWCEKSMGRRQNPLWYRDNQPYLFSFSFSGWILTRIIYGYAPSFWQVDWTALACFLSKDRTQSNGKYFVCYHQRPQ